MAKLKHSVKSNPGIASEWWVFILITIAAYWVYQPALSFGFTNWDDPTYVKDNPWIRDFSSAGFRKLFTVFLSGNYHPLVLVSYWMEMKWGGGDPTLFHKTNLVFHILNSALTFLLLRRVFSTFYPALFIALLFAVHPLHVESVAWVTERKDVLFGFFLLLSLWVYQLDSSARYSWKYFLSLFLFVLSGLSKGQAVMLVPALIALDFLSGKAQLQRVYIIRVLPFVLLAIGIGLLAVYTQQQQANVRVQAGYGFFAQMLIGFQGIWFYLSRTLVPIKLSAFYPYPDISEGIPLMLWLGALGGILILVTGLLTYRYDKKAFAGFAWFLLTIFPVLQFLPVGNAIAADRYYYIPAVGVFLLIAALLNKFIANLGIKGWIIPMVFVILMGYFSRMRTYVWKDSFSLWEDVISNYPSAAIAWNSLANAYYEQNQYQEAIQYFEAALKLDQSDPKSYNNLGNCYDRTGRPEAAVPLFKKALEIRPNDAMVYTNLGVAFDRLNKLDSAVWAQTRSVELMPSPLGYANLANVLEKQGDYEASAAYCRKALEMDPGYALAHNNLGVALYRLGQIEAAVQSLQEAARRGYGPAQQFLSQNGINW
jgi:protein O-mannosyl-transferase